MFTRCKSGGSRRGHTRGESVTSEVKDSAVVGMAEALVPCVQGCVWCGGIGVLSGKMATQDSI